MKNQSISFTALLGLTFIILKLTEVISWAWVWVLLPFWEGIGLALATVVLMGVSLLISKIFK